MKIPEHLRDYLRPDENPELTDARLAGELSKALSMREADPEGDWIKAEALIREAMAWHAQALIDAVRMRKHKARNILSGSDWVVARALETSVMGEEWCAWRDTVRRIAETGEGEIPPEPPRGRANPHMQAPVNVPMPEFLAEKVPHDVADLIDWNAPPKERQDTLLAKLREVAGLIGLAEDRGGRAAPELYARRDRIESGIRFNRATSVEEL